jgi:hypothetical protein
MKTIAMATNQAANHKDKVITFDQHRKHMNYEGTWSIMEHLCYFKFKSKKHNIMT